MSVSRPPSSPINEAPLIGDGRNAGAAQWKVAMRAPVRSGYPFELQSG
jgi:hypothetical protein